MRSAESGKKLISSSRLGRALPLVAIVFFLNASAALAQPSATDDLLHLVPRDSAFVLVINDLRGHAQRISQTGWYRGLADLASDKALLGRREVAFLAKVEKDLAKQLGVTWRQLRDDILGERVVFAFTPGRDDKSTQDRGLFLLRARDARSLAALVDRLNQLQRKTGEVTELRTVDHQGRSFIHRVEPKGSNYYFLKDGLLAFSDQEELIRGVIGQIGSAGGTSAARLREQLARAGADRALAALWVNPRAFDEELDQKIQGTGTAGGKGLRVFRSFWKATDALVLALHVDNDLALTFTVQAQPEALPPSARRLFDSSAKPSELWTRFPARAFFTVAGRVDAMQLADDLRQIASTAGDKQGVRVAGGLIGAMLGLDFQREVLPNLGPDWGLSISPAKERGHVPQAIAALAVRPGAGNVPVDQSLARALQNLAWWGVFEYNRTHDDRIQMQTQMQGDVEVKYLTNDRLFPPGFQPALALKDGYLLLASSPEAIAAFRKGNAVLPESGAPIFRLSLTELGRALDEHANLAADSLVSRANVAPAKARHLVGTATKLLGLFDSLSLTHRADSRQFSWSLHLRSAAR